MIQLRWRRHHKLKNGERERYRQQDEELREEIERALGRLPEQPARDDVVTVLGAFRREYATFARRNAKRLDKTNELYRALFRVVVAGGIVVSTVLILLGFLSVHLQLNQKNTLAQVQSGRRTALSVTCAVESAVAQAGRVVIAGNLNPPSPEQERALERFGFPSFAIRHKEEEKAADLYVATIARYVDRQIGRKGDGLIRHGGTLDCKRLAQIAKLHS